MIKNVTGKRNRGYQTVFFDLDGTITESGAGCMNGVKYMFGKIGYEETDSARIRAFVGPPIKLHLLEAYGFSDADAERAYTYYREYYDSKGMYENRLYDGIGDAIRAIRNTGKQVYIATTKPERLAIPILKRFALYDLFSGVFGARHDRGVINKIHVLEYAVDTIGHTPPDAVMVGDRCFDILGGRHMGFDTIGVLYGYGRRCRADPGRV